MYNNTIQVHVLIIFATSVNNETLFFSRTNKIIQKKSFCLLYNVFHRLQALRRGIVMLGRGQFLNLKRVTSVTIEPFG